MKTLLQVLLSLLFVTGMIVMGLDQGQAQAADSIILDCTAVDGQGLLCEGPTVAIARTADEATASDPDDQSTCPMTLGDGVVCTGPASELMVEDGEERPCPLPIGEGVVCTGPDIPSTEVDNENMPVEGNESGTAVQTPGLFLPFVIG